MFEKIFLLKKLIPRGLLKKLDTENYSIENFIIEVSSTIPDNHSVLDAGAGRQPYKKYFSHTDYVSTDIIQAYDDIGKELHSFTCSLDNIPIKTDFARCFILENSIIKEKKKEMLEDKMDISRFVLTNNNCVFKLDVMYFNRVFTISIPRFELN